MTRRLAAIVLSLFVGAASAAVLAGQQAPARTYFPAAATWERRDPGSVGVDRVKLDEAIAFSLKNENPNTRDLSVDIVNTFRNEAPYNTLVGPAKERGGVSGLVIRRGYVVAEWGDPARVDMTFSVTKSFLSTVVGVLYDRGQIKDVHDRAGTYMPAGVDLFASPHNSKITWDHLLRQTSDWSGTLWGKPDWADRPPSGQTPEQWEKRDLNEPGSFYKYNDTRVNVLALAALQVAREPLPAILKSAVMDPIGASATWHWEPYENSWVTIDGKRMPSVPGGGHFGGGMFINAWDMARFGYLFLRNGSWNGRRVISEKWMAMARTPGTATNAASSTYGYMNWFLNVPQRTAAGQPGRKMYAAAPSTAVAFRGNGENIIYIDWENDLVVVVRWIRGASGFFDRVMAALQ